MPNVSVIIPNYNHERYLQQRIDSVLAQTYEDYELIILDDQSTDNSRLIIEQYRDHPKVTHVVYNKVNSGSTFRQWEKGFALARGSWVWIAESDDYSDPQFLETLIKLSSRYERAGIVFSNSHWINEKGHSGVDLSIYNSSFYRPGTDEVKDGLAVHCTIQNASSCIIRKAAALQAIKGLGSYKACGDWIFYTRVLQNYDLVYSSKKLNYFRWYHASVSSMAKDRLWTTEGVDVLKNINFGKVYFSGSSFRYVVKHWIKKIRHLKLRYSFKSWFTILYAICRYYTIQLITPSGAISHSKQ